MAFLMTAEAYTNPGKIWARAFQAGGAASAKALRCNVLGKFK